MKGVENFYEKYYKKVIIIPLLLLLLSLIVLGINYSKTGNFINVDVSLKGGTTATIYKDGLSLEETELFLKSKFDDFSVRKLTDFSTRKDIGLIIEVSDVQQEELKTALKEEIDFSEEEISIEGTGPRFGQSFYKDLLIAILFAFLFMAVVVFITFRSLIPSLAVILAALIDLTTTLAITTLIGIKLSAAGIVAFLLVIGYSIDSDILLTTKVLKRRNIGALLERVKGAMKTGLTMTITTITALLVAFILATSSVLKQMFLIIFIALVIDIISTYLGNAPILISYCKKKGIT